MALFCCTAAMAETEINAVTITKSDDSKVVFMFANKPVITPGASVYTIADDSQSISIDMTENFEATFGYTDPSGIDEVIDNDDATAYYYVGSGEITIYNAKAGSNVYVYSVNGMLVNTVKCDADGQAVIETSDLNNGVYVIKNNDITFKYLK